MSVLMKKYWQL